MLGATRRLPSPSHAGAPSSCTAQHPVPVRTLVLAVALALGLSLGAGQPAYAADPNPVTPGDFTGYGFDQCLTPEQYKMNAWLRVVPVPGRRHLHLRQEPRLPRPAQPHAGVGEHAAAKGWRLLPITLGPQADCLDRFPRYGDDPTIIPTPGKNGRYSQARKQGSAEATTAVAEATRLGIVPGSTLWYDLEGFNVNNTTCRESALWFLSGWTTQIRRLGYVSGVYSSVGSGIKMLDDARVQRPGVFTLPDRIWLARWDGVANTSSDYILEDGWRPGGRMKQYKGGHDERWGGVKINIDSNFLELGNGLVAPAEVHCDGTRVNFKDYPRLAPPKSGKRPGKRMVTALKCLLREQGLYSGKLKGEYTPRLVEAIRAWKAAAGPGRVRRLEPAQLGGPVRRPRGRHREPGRQGRLDRRRRTPPPARAQRRQRDHPAPGHRRVRRLHRPRRCAPTRPATGSRCPASPAPRPGARWPGASARRGPPRPAR